MIKLNDKAITFTNFPNGETKVDGEQIRAFMHTAEINVVTFKFENDSDLIKLMFVKRYLDELNTDADLVIYYMPYSRMDRSEGLSVFTLKYVSEFMNSLSFNNVTVVEPHSDVTPALLNKSYAIYPTIDMINEVINTVGFNKHKDYLFFPDAGAQKRYGRVEGYQQLVGFKKRDFQTGQIKGLQVVGETEKVNGTKIIIVDDLCSYGGTFIMSSEKLKELGASEIFLIVGHCENSIFKGKVFESGLIDKVFTTDTILTDEMNWENQKYKNKLHVFTI
ncbi:ribose-phosphate pyrophosphokinase [Brevibacillus laterosporus]|nr:ribose-phosphate pyrophosphokinase [Brevibacillus laterosporus]TPG68586.1 ribose-phosphate pyrophosphokinase [Brevibacillus laterosporus]